MKTFVEFNISGEIGEVIRKAARKAIRNLTYFQSNQVAILYLHKRIIILSNIAIVPNDSQAILRYPPESTVC